ncbi:MAG: anaerobic ribonucleoside-triphosphate reductase [Candidatus Bathyarchaeia archaeon]
MSQKPRRLSLRILKATSSQIRLQVINLLYHRGPLSYTEIMNILKLNPTRDAGRFAYHLKALLKADIIEPDIKTKKYRLTELGKMIIDITDQLEEHAFKRKKMLVRTSRLALEEFDRNKIAESLIKEANVPIEMAQKIARETEARLQEFKTKYLTAPLIREMVNAILIEKGLEEYRHKLTRLGLPVYDVTQLIHSTETTSKSVDIIHEAAGDAVIEEYTLLNVLPRDIADAHISGSLHLNNLGYWILKPRAFMHDIRFFLRKETSNTNLPFPPPKSLKTALLLISNVIKTAALEVSEEQNIDFFNIFLSPFAKGLSEEEIKEELRFFLYNMPHNAPENGSKISLGLELTVPDFMMDKEAFGQKGEKAGYYKDYVQESQRILSLLLHVLNEEAQHKLLFNPNIIIKIRPESLANKECEHILYESHRLALTSGIPFFANLCPKEQKYASYTATGVRFASDWKGDWEIDTVQTANMDIVTLNLPRIAYNSMGKPKQFFELLDEPVEMALQALEIKYQTIKQRAKGNLLPFLTQKTNDNPYFRIENSLRLLNLVGLNETIKLLTGKTFGKDEEATKLALETISYLSRLASKNLKKPDTRTALSLTPNPEAAERLAKLDIEKYGKTVSTNVNTEKPIYTFASLLPCPMDADAEKHLAIEEKIHQQCTGGHITFLQAANIVSQPNELLSTTKNIINKYAIGLFAYNRNLSYCTNCHNISIGLHSKCPICASINTIRTFNTFHKNLTHTFSSFYV